MWAIIFAVFTVPLMIGFAIIGIFRVGKGISKGAHAITSSKSRKPAAEDLDETDTRMSTAMEPTNTSDDDIEMVSRAIMRENCSLSRNMCIVALRPSTHMTI